MYFINIFYHAVCPISHIDCIRLYWAGSIHFFYRYSYTCYLDISHIPTVLDKSLPVLYDAVLDNDDMLHNIG